jgi:hypothetical protein
MSRCVLMRSVTSSSDGRRRQDQELLSTDNGGLFQQYPGSSGHRVDEAGMGDALSNRAEPLLPRLIQFISIIPPCCTTTSGAVFFSVPGSCVHQKLYPC